MDTSLCSYSFHRRLAAGQHDALQYIADCQALGCTQLDLWNGHLPTLLDEDGRVGTAATPADGSLVAEELALLDRLRAAGDAAGLPMGCLAVDGAHLYEPPAEARALHRSRLLR